MNGSARVQTEKLTIGNVNTRARVLIPHTPPRGKVAFFHGRGGSYSRHLPLAEALANRGMTVLAFDFRGCGTTPGDPESLEGWASDAEDAVSYLRDFNPVRAPCAIYGSSFGGSLAVLMTERFDIAALVLRAPAIYPNDLWASPPAEVDRRREEVWRYRCAPNLTTDRTLRALSSYKGSVLIVGGSADDEVPSELLEAFKAAAISARARQLEVIVGAGHDMGRPHEAAQLRSVASTWLARTLADASPQ